MSSIVSSSLTNVASSIFKPQTAAPTSGATTTSSSSSSSTSIDASDFMTLLVAEMKNQDPTSPTDPTQYVQQLVGVNSLQQLIQINQGVNKTTTTATH